VFDAGKERIIEKVPAARQITIQDLFRHTSGLSYGNSGTTVVHKMYPVSSGTASQTLSGSEFLDRLGSLPLVYQPGTVWEYGFGLDVLGLVIESITEQPLGQYMQENLWKPLGMSDTSFVVPADQASRYARPLPNDPVTGQPQAVPMRLQKPKFECGGGCAAPTAGDYLRFVSCWSTRANIAAPASLVARRSNTCCRTSSGRTSKANCGTAVRRGTCRGVDDTNPGVRRGGNISE